MRSDLSKNYTTRRAGVEICGPRRDIICVLCKREPSTIADHVLDHRGNLTLFYDPKNIRGLCKRCHDERTGREHGHGDRKPDLPALVDGRVRDYDAR